MNSFPPVIDKHITRKPYLPKHPYELLSEQSQKIPFITGINYDEGLIKTAGEKIFDLFLHNQLIFY